MNQLALLLSLIVVGLPGTRQEPTFAQATLVQSGIVQPRPFNLDFEEGVVGQVPSGWISPTTPNYAAELSEDSPKSGRRSVLLHDTPAGTTAIQFGNLMQAIDAAPFRGRRVRLRAAVRTESSARAQLWMRVDRVGDQRGFFDNMQDRPITIGEWRYYEIVGDVDEDAAVLTVGMILIGKGKAWLDDVSITDLGKVIALAEPPRPLSARGLENLVAFTRLLGYVRHFHPSDEAASTDWNIFAVDGVKAIEDANDEGDLARKLQAVFHPIAPTVRVFVTGKPPPLPRELAPNQNDPSLKVISWRNLGFGQKSARQSIYQSERVTVEAPGGNLPPNSPDPQKPFRADLGAGVSALVPLALFSDAKGTLPHVAPQATIANSSLVKYTGNDRTTRLADVAVAWNIFQHFYPYFDVVQIDWPQALRTALSSAANDSDERAFLLTLQRMIAQLHDGHGGVYHPSQMSGYTAPVIFSWIEDRLVITDVAAGAAGLRPGDIVLRVEGRESRQVLAESEETISGATPQWRRYVAVNRLRLGARNSELRLEAQTQSGEIRSVTVRRNLEDQTLQETRPAKVSELRPGIFYLDLGRIKDEDFQKVLPQLEKAKGIIFDLRGYPTVSPAIISHLTDKPVESARWMVPIITRPDHAEVAEYSTSGRWKLEPIAPRLQARMVFLTDGRAISCAESYMGIIEAYKLADIVGEPTAGTNGNVNPFTLPGNYTVVWTGMKVLKNDGSRHHGVGIQPTVLVRRTIRGIAEQRDEQLDRAIDIVSR
jgi:C-terminal processing protease CtpA/Prc